MLVIFIFWISGLSRCYEQNQKCNGLTVVLRGIPDSIINDNDH